MRTIQAVISVFLVVLFFSGCAKKKHFAKSPVVPAATGKVKFKKDNNNNYIVTVNVVNLAPSKDLTPPKETYVVWMETKDESLKNVGQISPSTGFLSSALKGELKATATSKPRKIFITAEDGGNVQYPGGMLVLTTQ
jgi:hypothetical protein